MGPSCESRARTRASCADERGVHGGEAQELLAQVQLTDIVCAPLAIPVVLVPASLLSRALVRRVLCFGESKLSCDLVQWVLRFG
jgi:hypothetical protein